jgi:hypothetical protein
MIPDADFERGKDVLDDCFAAQQSQKHLHHD